jgi:hypothetical protein
MCVILDRLVLCFAASATRIPRGAPFCMRGRASRELQIEGLVNAGLRVGAFPWREISLGHRYAAMPHPVLECTQVDLTCSTRPRPERVAKLVKPEMVGIHSRPLCQVATDPVVVGILFVGGCPEYQTSGGVFSAPRG